MYRPSNSLVRLISRYFLPLFSFFHSFFLHFFLSSYLKAIVNGISSHLISFSASHSHIRKLLISVCWFVFCYFTEYIYLFLEFGAGSVLPFMYRIKVSANRENLTCLPIHNRFTSWSCLISLAKTFKTILNKLERLDTLFCYRFQEMLSVRFVEYTLILWKDVPFIPNLSRTFLTNGC